MRLRTLTEIKTSQGNILATIEWGKGSDAEINIVTSVFGKGEDNIVDRLNKGYARYINKSKALDYLHHSAPIAEALSNPKLVSVAKVVENFKNPEFLSKNVSKTDGKDEPLYRTSAEIDAEYPNWLNSTTTGSGKHSTQVAGTVGTYRKVGEWIKKNLGLGALTRGNPEAHGYLLSV